MLRSKIKQEMCQKSNKACYEARKSKIKYARRLNGCRQQLKNYIYTHKPQIQGPKTKERKKSARTPPLDCQEKREIKSFFMCLGKNLERKRERICLEKCSKMPKIIFFGLRGGSGGIYRLFFTLQLLAAIQWPPVSSNDPLGCARLVADVSSLDFFQYQLCSHI